jgi:acetyl esterase/lipase
MKRVVIAVLGSVFIVGCGESEQSAGPSTASPTSTTNAAPRPAAKSKPTLSEARRGFETKLVKQEKENEPVETPPNNLFKIVKYPSGVGELSAYLSPKPAEGGKHPAIIWIFGGFGNGIGDTAWDDADASNDQSASSFRKAGVIMMYPSLRGGNTNPGYKEGFFGEVDDVLAAADYLSKQDYVDPNRIYLGGHSTGGTMVLLAAEMSTKFRAVFSIGPVDDPRGYGPENTYFDIGNNREGDLRSPGRWLDSIKTPVFVIEGQDQGNVDSLLKMSNTTLNPSVQYFLVPKKNHFSVILPVTRLLAEKVVKDQGPAASITMTKDEIDHLP